VAAPDPSFSGTAPAPDRRAIVAPLLAVALAAAGLALRLVDFGRHDFWNDEAWVALSTRVEGVAQFWLSIAVTPPLWAATLQPLAALPAPPEVALRVLPLLFGLLTLATGYRVGSMFAGNAVGGIAAVAVLAGDPMSVVYSRELKHYTAEAFFALLAFGALMRCTRTERLADLVRLSLVLVVGMLFANSQLLVTPAVLGALLVSSAVRRRQFAAAVGVAAMAVGALQLGYFRLALASRMPRSLIAYWEGAYVPHDSIIGAARFVYDYLAAQMDTVWRPLPAAPAVLCLVAVTPRGCVRRTAGLALALLVTTVTVVSSMHLMPMNEPRITLFLLTCLGTLAAASLGLVASRAWTRPWLRPVVAAAAVFAAVALVRRVDRIVPPHAAEDLGSLVRVMEEERQPGDGVLLYERSGYVYAYYQRLTPHLVADAALTVGFRPRIDDTALLVIDGRTPEAAVEQALATHARVWLLGSRFRGDDEARVREALRARAATRVEERRARALLILAVRDAAPRGSDTDPTPR
jgi:hypothetical protein